MNSFTVSTIANITEGVLFKVHEKGIDNYYIKNEDGQVFGTTVFPFPQALIDECKAKKISILKLNENNCKSIEDGFDFIKIQKEYMTGLDDKEAWDAFKLGFEKRNEIDIKRNLISEHNVRLMLMDMARFAVSKEMVNKWDSDIQAFHRQRDLFIDKQIYSLIRKEWNVKIETKLSWEYVDTEYREPVKIYIEDQNNCIILKNK